LVDPRVMLPHYWYRQPVEGTADRRGNTGQPRARRASGHQRGRPRFDGDMVSQDACRGPSPS